MKELFFENLGKGVVGWFIGKVAYELLKAAFARLPHWRTVRRRLRNAVDDWRDQRAAEKERAADD